MPDDYKKLKQEIEALLAEIEASKKRLEKLGITI